MGCGGCCAVPASPAPVLFRTEIVIVPVAEIVGSWQLSAESLSEYFPQLKSIASPNFTLLPFRNQLRTLLQSCHGSIPSSSQFYFFFPLETVILVTFANKFPACKFPSQFISCDTQYLWKHSIVFTTLLGHSYALCYFLIRSADHPESILLCSQRAMFSEGSPFCPFSWC